MFKAGKIPAVMQLPDKANPYSPQVHVLLMCAVQTDGKENKVEIQNTRGGGEILNYKDECCR